MNLSTRHAYIISYDICDSKRLTQVRKILLGFGEHVQLSVFHCELTMQDMIELRSRLSDVIKVDKDQIILANLGPANGRAVEAIDTLGRAWIETERSAIVV